MTVATAVAEPQTAPAATFVPSTWWDYASTAKTEALAKAKTPERQAKAAGLDWLVGMTDVYSKVVMPDRENTERYVLVPGKKAITRLDKGLPLSIMGSRYAMLQNIAMFEFGDSLTDGGLKVIGAGEFGGGRVTWVQFELPQEIVVGGDPSAVKPYLLLFTSHDGTRPFGALLTFVRVWCKNTFNSAIRGAADKYVIRHTPGAKGKVDEARRVLGLTFDAVSVFEKVAQSLAKKPMDLAGFTDYVDLLIPVREGPADVKARASQTEEAHDVLVDLWNASPLLEGVDKTYWRAFNATTEWLDHHRDYRASAGSTMVENKALSLMDGQAAAIKGKALELLRRN